MRPSTRRTSTGRRRRGMATLVVMLLISVALAVAYVSMRSQTMTLQVQQNATLRASARDAAMAGMAIALKTMQTSSWSGVSSTLSQSLGDDCRFQATYTTGDASLDSSDDDYDEYPYRVTIAVTGYATGSDGHEISHSTSAVVRLVPRALADEPTGWSDITNYTLCQWSSGTFMITVPAHIHGPARVRGAMDLSEDQLPWTDDARWWYFYGLSQLQQAGYADRRPFTGPVYLPFASQRSATYNLLYSALWASPTDTSSTTTVSWPSTTLPSGYRLYTGGQLYTATVLGSTVQDTTLEPDPKTNPLGAFYRAGTLTVNDNVSLHGTILLTGGTCADLVVAGANVSLSALELPPLVDSTGTGDVPVRLPTVFAADDVQFSDGAQATLTGLIVAIDQFIVDKVVQGNISVAVTGKVTAQDIEIYRRYGWYLSSATWASYFSAFHTQRSTGIAYYPTFLQSWYGLKVQPVISIDPDGTEVRYHWQDPSNPIYVPHADDLAEGVALRWEVVRWGE